MRGDLEGSDPGSVFVMVFLMRVCLSGASLECALGVRRLGVRRLVGALARGGLAPRSLPDVSRC